MRISDVAKQQHISEQAVRNRITRAGYNLSDLRKPGSNVFSPEGEQIIEELFRKKPKQTAKQKQQEKKQSIIEVKAERDDLKVRFASAMAISEERAATISLLREELKNKDDQIRALLALSARLPEPEPEQNLTFFQWLKSRKTAKNRNKKRSENKKSE